uniref:Si:ch211-266o15.1 n=1 Tax=Cyprinus carpio TaxID=7962 RepID=A0A8C2E2P4_CYPCA
MDKSSELEIKTSADQGESSSGQPVDDELDGLPVFGTDEDDWEIDSSFAQKALEQMERNSDDKNESQDGVPTSENSSSINGSSEMDEERAKVSEDTPLQSEPPSECTDRETSYSPVIRIKDEPIDEEYDKALMPQSDMSRIKQELDGSENNENEASSASDELRISSVFSVSGNSSDAVSASMAPSHASSFSVMSQNAATLRGTTILLPAQSQTPLQLRLQPKTQMHPRIQTRSRMQPPMMPQTHLQPPPQPPQVHAPPPTVRICCSGCSKVLQKGQTAFQRKGSNQLFCSTVCLTSFSLPSVQFTPIIAPKKTCHLCLKVIVNLKDLITIPVGSMNTLKEFCSQACLSIYKNRYEDATPDLYTQCGVCKLVKEIQHEVTHLGAVHKLCSDECFARFRSSRNLYMSYCENCGNCTASGNYHLVQIEDSIKKFCCTECISNYKQVPQHNPNELAVLCSSCVGYSWSDSFIFTSLNQIAAPPRSTTDHLQPTQTTSSVPAPNHNPPPPFVPPSNQNPVPTYVPTPGVVKSQDTQQQRPIKPPSSSDTVRLMCKQCQNHFSSKPEVFQFKGHAGLFCSRACCDTYKRESSVKALCEYCKIEKVVKDIITYEKQPRSFCCEGCKLLFKHDLAKRHGGQCRVCAYCQNMTHKTIQNFFGGKLEEFCTEECMSLYTVLFYEMAKCHGCKNQGSLKESLVWDGTTRHFCNLSCLLQFCSKCITPHQPASNGSHHVVLYVKLYCFDVSLNGIKLLNLLINVLIILIFFAGALPTSNASSKNIGEASTQTDAAVAAIPYRRTLKNKALMCRPITEEQGVQCQPEPPIAPNLGETVIDENGETVKLVPVPVPIPVPVYIPVPMHLYTQYTPFPMGLPLPVPVPMVIPGSQDSAEQKDTKCSLPAQSSVEDDDVEKGKDKPVSHDQGSTYSGDLESEARSTPFSWADTEDPGVSVKPLVPSTELGKPVAAPTTSLSSEQPDLENDFPRSTFSSPTVSNSGGPMTVKEDLLQCTSADLSYGLCRFIKEVRRPNGEPYEPDSIYYLCLGIQQCLLENERLENIFTDSLYSQFISDITTLLKDWGNMLPPGGYIHSRVEEEYLWECKQLGALSPIVLLNTLLFFGAKLLNLKTAEEHRRLAFSNVSHCSKTTKNGMTAYLRFRLPGKEEEKDKKAPAGKRRREEETVEEEFLEMPENVENPLRCPVRLYEFYLSKCSNSVKQRPDLFYLQ